MTKKMPASKLEWKKWGDYDPLWGVASWSGRSRDGSNPWNDHDFYSLGESDWEDFLVYWERYGLEKDSVLEIGCGAGRVTLPLGKCFNIVHAVDVSEGMLAYAKERVKSPTIHYYLSDGLAVPLPNTSVSAVFSCHVFQHFDSNVHATEYFNEIYRVLKPGGSMMVHLPICIWPIGMGKVIPFIYKIRKLIGYIKASINRLLIKYINIKPTMRGTSYSLGYIYDTLKYIGYKNIEVSVVVTKSNMGIHPFVFAKK